MIKYLPAFNYLAMPMKLRQAKQRGSALIIALFVIIVMAMLGTAMVNMQRTSSETIAQEVLGTRALAAARSGMQAHLQKLFPLGSVTGACLPFPIVYPLENINGLNNCRASLTCQLYAFENNVGYYRVVSTGSCGSGDMESDSDGVVISSRTIQVNARTL